MYKGITPCFCLILFTPNPRITVHKEILHMLLFVCLSFTHLWNWKLNGFCILCRKSWNIIKEEIHIWLIMLGSYERFYKLLKTSPRARQSYKYYDKYLSLKELSGISLTAACQQRCLDTASKIWTFHVLWWLCHLPWEIQRGKEVNHFFSSTPNNILTTIHSSCV